MTDLEKAEEILQTKGHRTFCAKGCGYTEKVKELITIGLAEGRKEKCFEQNKDGTIRPCEVMKENEELHRDKTELTNLVTELKTKVTELEKENKIILEDNDTLNKWVDKLRKENEQLKQKLSDLTKDKDLLMIRNLDLVRQIEKMKCCNNCNYLACLDEEQHLYGCIIANDCEDYEKWKLAE